MALTFERVEPCKTLYRDLFFRLFVDEFSRTLLAAVFRFFFAVRTVRARSRLGALIMK